MSGSEMTMIQMLTDAIFPGAIEARAYEFILRDMKSNSFLVDLYHEGLRELDQASQQSYHKGLLDLDEIQLHSLLKKNENEAFFMFLRDHTIEGIFSDPIYGGNYEAYGWRLIGFAGPKFYPPETLNEPELPTIYYSLEGIAYEEKNGL